MSSTNFSLTLHIWRQRGPAERGHMEVFERKDVSPDQSFLEMLDDLNEDLVRAGKEPVAFEHDCREGICGCCGLMVNGHAHGGEKGTTLCQVHMRSFTPGSHIFVEPWRARAFPILRDLVVDRAAFDEIQQAGGYISVNTGQAPEAGSLPVPKDRADQAMDAAACIGCGACVAACKNASAMLFVGARVSHFVLLPQGEVERARRALAMVEAADRAGFGNCTNEGECSAACPKQIEMPHMARMFREYLRAALTEPTKVRKDGGA
jgi:succinate dehydrogenase / fumarate reductase, iron-sulfur subunit